MPSRSLVAPALLLLATACDVEGRIDLSNPLDGDPDCTREAWFDEATPRSIPVESGMLMHDELGLAEAIAGAEQLTFGRFEGSSTPLVDGGTWNPRFTWHDGAWDLLYSDTPNTAVHWMRVDSAGTVLSAVSPVALAPTTWAHHWGSARVGDETWVLIAFDSDGGESSTVLQRHDGISLVGPGVPVRTQAAFTDYLPAGSSWIGQDADIVGVGGIGRHAAVLLRRTHVTNAGVATAVALLAHLDETGELTEITPVAGDGGHDVRDAVLFTGPREHLAVIQLGNAQDSRIVVRRFARTGAPLTAPLELATPPNVRFTTGAWTGTSWLLSWASPTGMHVGDVPEQIASAAEVTTAPIADEPGEELFGRMIWAGDHAVLDGTNFDDDSGEYSRYLIDSATCELEP